jgi:sugar lactone lactonase YvrE
MLTYPCISTGLGALCLLAGYTDLATAQEFPPPPIVFAGVQSVIPTRGLSAPSGLAVDSEGNLYIADTGNDRVVEITAAGAQRTVASGVVAGAALKGPTAVAVDTSFNIYVADPENNRLVEVTPDGEARLIGTGLSHPSGVAVDSVGNVYIADTGHDQIVEVSHGVQTIAIGRHPYGDALSMPTGISVFGSAVASDQDELVITSSGGGTVVEAAIKGSKPVGVQVLATGLNNPISAVLATPTDSYASDSQYVDDWVQVTELEYGELFVADAGSSRLWSYSSFGNIYYEVSQQMRSSPLGVSSPGGLAIDSSGNIYISDSGKNRIRKMTTGYSVNFGSVAVGRSGATVSLTLSFLAKAEMPMPSVVTRGAIDKDFKLADSGTCKIGETYEANSICTLDVIFAPRVRGEREGALNFAGGSGGVGNAGTVYLHGGGNAPQTAYSPGAQTTLATGFKDPQGVAVDGDGNAYVADHGDGEIYKVTPSGAKSAFAMLKEASSLAMDGAGNLYAVASDPAQYPGTSFYEIGPGGRKSDLIGFLIKGYEPLTPADLAVGGSGDLFAAFTGGNVLETTLSSVGTNILSKNFQPGGLAVGGAGNVFITDQDNSRVWRVTPNGAKSTLGSGYNRPEGIAVDAEGDVFVADFGNNRVVQVTPEGKQSTVGSGLSEPTAVAVDDLGNIYITDAGNGRLVKIDRRATR